MLAGALLAFVAVLLGAPAQGQLDLSFEAPEGCPSQQDVRDEVLRLLEREPEEPFDARIEVRREGARWMLRLEGGGGERELSGESCQSLTQAAALIIALAVDPTITPRAPADAADAGPDAGVARDAGMPADAGREPDAGRAVDAGRADSARAFEPLADAGAAPAADSATSDSGADADADADADSGADADSDSDADADADADADDADPDPDPDTPRTWSPMRGLALSVAGGVEARSLPSLTPVFELELSLPLLRHGRLSIALLATLPQRGRVPMDDAEATLHLYTARASGGVERSFGIVGLGAFGIVELGFTGGRGEGVDAPQSAWTPWIALGAGASVGIYASSRVALLLEGDARFPLWRPEFVLEGGPGVVHQAESIVARGVLRIRAHLR